MANNPLDYLIKDQDAMRYALLNDSSYRQGGAVRMQEGGGVFNPQGADYDYQTARAYGMGQGNGNWGSVAPASESERALHGLPEDSYLMLKGAQHPTWHKAVEAEESRGSKIVKYGDRYYSVPSKAEGGIIDGHPIFQTAQVPFSEYRHSIGMRRGGEHFDEGGLNDQPKTVDEALALLVAAIKNELTKAK